MISKFSRWITSLLSRSLFVVTSFSPVVFTLSVSQFESQLSSNKQSYWYLLTFSISLFMIGLCWLMLKYIERYFHKGNINIQTVDRRDGDILTYLFVFLIPFIRSNNSLFGSQILTTTVCAIIIILAIADIGAYHYNPVLRIFRYRIYSVNIDGNSGILIAKTDNILYGNNIRLNVVSIANSIYIHNEGKMNV